MLGSFGGAKAVGSDHPIKDNNQKRPFTSDATLGSLGVMNECCNIVHLLRKAREPMRSTLHHFDFVNAI